MRCRSIILAPALIVLPLGLALSVFAQGRGNTPSRPTPRWPDGHVNLGSPPGEIGLWERRNEHLVINYEVTIDDPGAYTAPWTSGYTLTWSKGLQLFEYVCQQNNISPESMTGGLTSAIAP